MRINRDKLPVKYALEVYPEIPGYPSHSDLEHVLLSTLQDKGLLGKEFTAEQVWDGMRHVQGTLADLRGFLDYLFQPDDGNTADFNIKGHKPSSTTYNVSTHSWV